MIPDDAFTTSNPPSGLLAELPTLNAGTTQQLTVLLLGHALTALLNDRTHNGFPRFLINICVRTSDADSPQRSYKEITLRSALSPAESILSTHAIALVLGMAIDDRR